MFVKVYVRVRWSKSTPQTVAGSGGIKESRSLLPNILISSLKLLLTRSRRSQHATLMHMSNMTLCPSVRAIFPCMIHMVHILTSNSLFFWTNEDIVMKYLWYINVFRKELIFTQVNMLWLFSLTRYLEFAVYAGLLKESKQTSKNDLCSHVF